ncbi:MAG: HAD domain-containing protein, partial [Betaproteobacteria bacterium]
GEHLAERFIGAIPDSLRKDLRDTYRSREMECLAWLHGNGQPGGEWIAVDDVASNFTFPQPRLVLIDPATGLTANDVGRIVAQLRENL